MAGVVGKALRGFGKALKGTGKESSKKHSLKDRRDESYGKWGKRKSGKINK